MQVGKAIVAGLMGALAMTAVLAVARILGSPVNLNAMLGSMVTGELGSESWLIGLSIHLWAGAGFALLYAAMFEYSAHRASAGVGALYGLGHAVVSGLLLGAAPLVHPLVPGELPEPRLFLSGYGLLGVLLFACVHLLYGAVVGSMYAPVKVEHRQVMPAAR